MATKFKETHPDVEFAICQGGPLRSATARGSPVGGCFGGEEALRRLCSAATGDTVRGTKRAGGAACGSTGKSEVTLLSPGDLTECRPLHSPEICGFFSLPRGLLGGGARLGGGGSTGSATHSRLSRECAALSFSKARPESDDDICSPSALLRRTLASLGSLTFVHWELFSTGPHTYRTVTPGSPTSSTCVSLKS